MSESSSSCLSLASLSLKKIHSLPFLSFVERTEASGGYREENDYKYFIFTSVLSSLSLMLG